MTWITDRIKTLIVLALLLAGCAVDEQPPQVYTCTVLYRCTGAPVMNARIALPCASSEDEADERAADAMIAAMPEACPMGWQYVRPLCEPYDPATSCAAEDPALTTDVAEQ